MLTATAITVAMIGAWKRGLTLATRIGSKPSNAQANIDRIVTAKLLMIQIGIAKQKQIIRNHASAALPPVIEDRKTKYGGDANGYALVPTTPLIAVKNPVPNTPKKIAVMMNPTPMWKTEPAL